MRERIRQAQARLQAAAATGEYQGAAKALDELLEAIEEGVQRRVGLEDLLPGVLEELERARRLILASRAHDAARLARTRKPPVEYGNARAAPPSVRLEG